ncbi:amidohydrolase family protein, partial [Aquicoccus sp. SCR17]|nr:amidohydrolase family protein [Carideicomes alvinocaridis]
SHDDRTAGGRADWRARGATIAEFPETEEAALAAHEAGDAVVLGAPNVLRGGSHRGNASARDLIASGHCAALASDYHYPAPAIAALRLAREGVLGLGAAWALVSAGPAGALGLSDRGALAPGLRADLVAVEAETGRIALTMAGGAVTHLAGPLARRLIG